MVDLIEARVITRTLPRGVRVPQQLRLVLRRRADGWRLDAPLDEDVFPLARWLCDEPILAKLDAGACLAIEPHGQGGVALQLHATRGSVDRFLEWIKPDAEDTRVRRLAPVEAESPSLTPAQEDALRRAVALGYYHIPRSIHLSELAAKLQVSPAALSERLRRAEARLVTHFVEHDGEAAAGAED